MAYDIAESQKRRERFLFESFSSIVGLELEVVDQPSPPAPDLIVRDSHEDIGVEITDIFISPDNHGGSTQAQESISEQILRRAQQFYERAENCPAHVSVCFAPNRNISHLNRDDTAHELAKFVGDLNLAPWQAADLSSPYPKSGVPDEIFFIHALGVPTYDMAHWAVARSGWVAPLTTGHVQSAIDAKAKNIDGYRQQLERVWLLIVADCMRPSSNIQMQADFEASNITSPFDRTFVFEYPSRTFELG